VSGAEADLPEARLPAKGDRPVEVLGGLLVARPVAAPVDHVQGFPRVRQGQDQRVVAPLPLVVDVHPLLALAPGLDHRAVGVEDRLGEERLGLATPDEKPHGMEDLLQVVDGRLVEAAAEVAGRGRVGDAAGPQSVEIGLLVAEQFQVLQAGPSRQEVVGDVEHVIGFVVGQMDLQQPQSGVDRPIESQGADQEVDQADPAVGRGPGAFGDLVVDI
jgi:hypothetical protein